jgi:hypothetical protein
MERPGYNVPILEHQWSHAGFRCAVCIMLAHRNGYVRVPLNHPSWCRVAEFFDVHGGITFDGGHLSIEALNDPAERWRGFDTGHFQDGHIPEYVPAEVAAIFDRHPIPDQHVWTLDEVIAETNSLAEQLAQQPWWLWPAAHLKRWLQRFSLAAPKGTDS